ncbi:MAG: galactokinase [Bacteroidales bacterium]|nr:galactokinase [Bacteroidales bacterium]
MEKLQNIIQKFSSLYATKPYLYRAPGRINIIGEHTDYNKGFVLPAAISKEMYFALAPNNDKKIRLYAFDMNEFFEISLAEISKPSKCIWANYMLGVIAQLTKRSLKITGVDVVFGGTIPIGAGVSSSAAIECGFLFALNDIYNLQLDDISIAQYAQYAEHEFIGVQCGIMDQFAVVFGKKDSALWLDCDTLEHAYIPLLLHDYKIVLCNSNVTHTLASSEYNVRRNQCVEGVQLIAKKYPSVTSLRDVSLSMLEDCRTFMPQILYNRCLFVVQENARVHAMCDALKKNDVALIGDLLYQSHEGLQHVYEVSCNELDELVAIAQQIPGVLGARMMGGGFGGCTLQVVHNESIELFIETVKKEYYIPRNQTENIIITEISQGVSKINL